MGMKYQAILEKKIQELFEYGGRNLYSERHIDKYINAVMEHSAKKRKAYDTLIKGMPVLPDSKAFVGIEVEVENIQHDVGIYGWEATKDGSLRNSGREYISFVYSPSAVNRQLAYLYSELVSMAPLPNFSWRTSIHVHLCFRERTVEELLKLFLLYLTFERILFQFADKEREHSVFCVPLTKSSLAEDLSVFFSQKASINTLLNHWHKYSALNLFRMADYGTVEFRHLPGTWETKKISTWIGILLSLYNAAIEMPLEKIIEEIKTLNTTSEYTMFRDEIFKEFAHHLPIPDFGLVSEGVSFCKECLSGINSYKISEKSSMMRYIRKENDKKEDLLKRVRIIPRKDGLVAKKLLERVNPKIKIRENELRIENFGEERVFINLNVPGAYIIDDFPGRINPIPPDEEEMVERERKMERWEEGDGEDDRVER